MVGHVLNDFQGKSPGEVAFVYDKVMELRSYLQDLSMDNCIFTPRVENLFRKLKDQKPMRSMLSQAATRGHKYLDVIMRRHPKQWQFYKKVRVLNPSNLPSLLPSASEYPILGLPVAHKDFAAGWGKYYRVERIYPSNPEELMAFWSRHQGVLAETAKLLLSVPVTSADVERSFSLAGVIDTKLRHSLPDDSRRATCMLMFNGDIEGRF
eukprot:EG_transcript_17274